MSEDKKRTEKELLEKEKKKLADLYNRIKSHIEEVNAKLDQLESTKFRGVHAWKGMDVFQNTRNNLDNIETALGNFIQLRNQESLSNLRKEIERSTEDFVSHGNAIKNDPTELGEAGFQIGRFFITVGRLFSDLFRAIYHGLAELTSARGEQNLQVGEAMASNKRFTTHLSKFKKLQDTVKNCATKIDGVVNNLSEPQRGRSESEEDKVIQEDVRKTMEYQRKERERKARHEKGEEQRKRIRETYGLKPKPPKK